MEKICTLDILFGSETGNSENLALDIQEWANNNGFVANVHDMLDIDLNKLSKMSRILLIISTYGEGEPTDNASVLYDAFTNNEITELKNQYFSVIALGDSIYDNFCQAGKDFDSFFEKAGAKRLHKRIDLDIDYEDHITKWYEKNLPDFLTVGKKENAITIETQTKETNLYKYCKKNPTTVKIIDIKLLSKKESTKKVFKILIEPSKDDLYYKIGDCIAIMPKNSTSKIHPLLERVNHNLNKNSLEFKDLVSNLKNNFEIRIPNQNLINDVLNITKVKKITNLKNDNIKLSSFLSGKEIIDLLRISKVEYDLDYFLNLLQPLQYRLYSIASSPKVNKKSIEIIIKKVNYNNKIGTTSSYITNDKLINKDIKIYIQPNKNFTIPKDHDTPIIMIGPGTGVAPFLGFIEERIYNKSLGKNWLIFGDRNKKFDFILKEKLTSYVKKGLLELDIAWSRDENKKYVQDILDNKAKELYNLLELGAHIYVCGDATKMAHDVEMKLLEIIAKYGAMPVEKAINYLNNLKQEKRYVRDVY